MMKLSLELLKNYSRRKNIFEDKKGVAAIEFAIVFPFILLMFFASIEAILAFTAKRKVSAATHAIADIASRERVQLFASDINGIDAVARLIMTPFNVDDAKVSISGATVDADGKDAVVNWTAFRSPNSPSAPPKRSVDEAIALPSELQADTFIIIVETELSYDTLFGSINLINPFANIQLPSTYTLSETSFFQSRSGEPILGPGGF